MGMNQFSVADITIPYGEKYREQALNIVKKSGKDTVYNGYLMPTSKIPLGTLSHTERAQILMLAKDQVDMAYEAGVKYFMQSTGTDPGSENRKDAFECLGEYIYELSCYMSTKGDVAFLIELMDRDVDKKSLCGPTEEVVGFLDRLKAKVPNVGLVVDLAHIPLMKESISHVFRTSEQYIRHVHLGNCIMKDRSSEWWGDKHPPIGIEGGEIDIPELKEVFEILLDMGYLNNKNPGTMTLEIKPFTGKSEDETIRDNLIRLNKAWEMI